MQKWGDGLKKAVLLIALVYLICIFVSGCGNKTEGGADGGANASGSVYVEEIDSDSGMDVRTEYSEEITHENGSPPNDAADIGGNSGSGEEASGKNTDDQNENSTHSGGKSNDTSPAENGEISESGQKSAESDSGFGDKSSEKQPGGQEERTSSEDGAHEVCVHKWIPRYEEIECPELGHYEDIETIPSWDEEIVERKAICNICSMSFDSEDEVGIHLVFEHDGGNYRIDDVVVGTIHHDAVFENTWVVDVPSHKDKVPAGYICSECGEMKNGEENN